MKRESIHSSVITVEDNPSDGCVENAFGCVGWFMDIVRNEKLTQLAISQNKAASKRYVESFEEGWK